MQKASYLNNLINKLIKMKKLFFAMLVAVAAVGFTSCGGDMTDQELKEAITGKTFEGSYSDATIRMATLTGYTFILTVAAEPVAAGTYDVIGGKMICTDVDGTTMTATIQKKGKELELLNPETGAVLATLVVK
ncbi:MAG: hypothetical protein LBT04_03820 [Prevotellaceae bacterium]|jgi:hypothetical protein|nr:hypothetical protein [Prevotellaceae bacterium]